MKKLIISILAAALLFTACGVPQNSQSESELDTNLTLTEVLEPDYRKNYKRITAEQLWGMRDVFSEYDELVDGYAYEDSYIIYSIYKEQYIPYNRIYLVKEENGYTVQDTIKNAEEWHRNLFKDSGMTTELKYIVNYSCLPNDESESKVYNDAINAYNEFLAQQAEETLEWFNEDDQGLISPIPFAYLKDLHGDGIPEIIAQCAIIGPQRVFSYVNDEIVELAGAMSNGMHGGCYLLENGMYGSRHHSTGWVDSFVAYNKDGTQTIERFFSNDIDEFSYEKYTVDSAAQRYDTIEEDVYRIVFENTDEGKQQFYDMYAPYTEALEHRMDLGESYYPFDVDTTYNYSPYVTKELEQNG